MNEYVEYKNSLCSLKGQLGLNCFHIISKDEFMPYITKIISKLNEKLVMEDKARLEDRIKLFIEYYEDGLDKYAEGFIDEIDEEYGFESEDPEFKQDLFDVSWTNIFSSIYLQEMYNYAYLFTDTPIDCHECCGVIGKDELGNNVYIPDNHNLSSEYYCKCGK